MSGTYQTGLLLEAHTAPDEPRGGLVMEEAEQAGWIVPFAPGQYAYAPRWTALVRRFQTLLVERATARGFEEWLLPRLIPGEALDAFELTHYRPDMLIPAGFGDDAALDPVQCVSLYRTLRGRVFEVPLRVVECLGGWTWRNEAVADYDGPFRAKEFGRVEHVYIGSPGDVTAIRRSIRAGVTDLLTDLGLSWRVVVGEGCMEIPSLQLALDQASTDDQAPVHDIEVRVGGALRDPDPTAHDFEEIAGCSVEGRHLIENFGLDVGDLGLWSGCCGVGLNRLVVAFLYQHGLDRSAWPAIAAPA